jgi:hypothetical protein
MYKKIAGETKRTTDIIKHIAYGDKDYGKLFWAVVPKGQEGFVFVWDWYPEEENFRRNICGDSYKILGTFPTRAMAREAIDEFLKQGRLPC